MQKGSEFDALLLRRHPRWLGAIPVKTAYKSQYKTGWISPPQRTKYMQSIGYNPIENFFANVSVVNASEVRKYCCNSSGCYDVSRDRSVAKCMGNFLFAGLLNFSNGHHRADVNMMIEIWIHLLIYFIIWIFLLISSHCYLTGYAKP